MLRYVIGWVQVVADAGTPAPGIPTLTTYLLTQGVLGVAVLALSLVVRHLYKTNREDTERQETQHKLDLAAKDTVIAGKDVELRALHEKVQNETIPLLTRVVVALERYRGSGG